MDDGAPPNEASRPAAAAAAAAATTTMAASGPGPAESLHRAQAAARHMLPVYSRLLTLADELILHILERIGDLEALRNVALTCSYLNQLAEPYVYESVLVRSAKEAARLVKSLKARRSRAAAIRKVEIRYGKGIDPEDGIEILNPEIEDFPNLRTWSIESPCVNDTHWRPEGVPFHCHGRIDYISLFQSASILRPVASRKLQNLQSFSLHSHVKGASLFKLEGGAVIFHHPTLRRLHLACFDILPTEKYFPLGVATYSTALEDLTFEECNIDGRTLDTVLSIPKALRSLSIGERIFHFRASPTAPLAISPSILLQALGRQAHSLRYLRHTGIGLSHFSGIPRGVLKRTDLLQLERLEEMDLRADSILQWYLGVRGDPSNAPVIPQSLKVLRVHDVNEMFLDDCPRLFAREPSYWRLPGKRESLQLLELVMRPKHCSEEELLGDLWEDADRRERVFEFGRRMKECGTRFTVQAVKSEGFIPPYMYGEVLPYQVTAYDSDKPMLFGQTVDREVEQRAEDHQVKSL